MKRSCYFTAATPRRRPTPWRPQSATKSPYKPAQYRLDMALFYGQSTRSNSRSIWRRTAAVTLIRGADALHDGPRPLSPPQRAADHDYAASSCFYSGTTTAAISRAYNAAKTTQLFLRETESARRQQTGCSSTSCLWKGPAFCRQHGGAPHHPRPFTPHRKQTRNRGSK